MQDKKVILIGLDGATWDLIEPWANNNELPTFKKLMENGCYGPLESTVPHVTPPAWTSMTTGKNPAKHGIFDFMSIEKENNHWNQKLYSSKNKKSKEIWDYVEGKSIIVNVPLTYPPRKINGIMVTGMYTPSKNSQFTYPEGFKNEILNLFPDYQIGMSWNEYRDTKQSFLNNLYSMTEERIKLFWHLFKMDWDFFFFVFIGTDRIQHFLWGDDELLGYYKYLDVFLGKVVEEIENHNINLFLTSDHGFGKIKKVVHINSFLKQEGYLKLKTSNQFLGKTGVKKESLMRLIQKFGLGKIYKNAPQRLLNIFRKNIPGHSNPAYDFDLESSEAVMTGTGSIFVTKDGPQKKEVIDQLKHKLESLKDSEDNRVIYRVFKKEELYSGKLLKKAPDLVLLPNEGYSLVHSLCDDIIKESGVKKADHTLNGIFLGYGPDIKEGGNIKAKIYDLAPTILHLFNMPIPDDMDGRVLKEIFKEESEHAQREVKTQKSTKEGELVRSKLKELKKSGKL